MDEIYDYIEEIEGLQTDNESLRLENEVLHDALAKVFSLFRPISEALEAGNMEAAKRCLKEAITLAPIDAKPMRSGWKVSHVEQDDSGKFIIHFDKADKP